MRDVHDAGHSKRDMRVTKQKMFNILGIRYIQRSEVGNMVGLGRKTKRVYMLGGGYRQVRREERALQGGKGWEERVWRRGFSM